MYVRTCTQYIFVEMFRSTPHFHRPPSPRARRKDRRTGGPPGATRMPWPPRSSARKTPRYPRRSGRGSQDHLPSSALEAVDHRHLLPPPSLEMFVPWAPTSVHEENGAGTGRGCRLWWAQSVSMRTCPGKSMFFFVLAQVLQESSAWEGSTDGLLDRFFLLSRCHRPRLAHLCPARAKA